MSNAPPTTPGAILPRSASPIRARSQRSAVIHAIALALTSFVTPLAMGSNIWPIAGVFWSVLTAPVAALIGAGVGALVGRSSRAVSLTVIVSSLSITSIVACAIILRNR